MAYAIAKTDRSGCEFLGDEPRLAPIGTTVRDVDFPPTVVWIGRLLCEDGTFRDLRSPLRIDVSRDPDDGNFVAYCRFANSGGIGSTPEAAQLDLGHEILRFRDELASTDDDQLAGDALALKRRLLFALP